MIATRERLTPTNKVKEGQHLRLLRGVKTERYGTTMIIPPIFPFLPTTCVLLTILLAESSKSDVLSKGTANSRGFQCIYPFYGGTVRNAFLRRGKIHPKKYKLPDVCHVFAQDPPKVSDFCRL